MKEAGIRREIKTDWLGTLKALFGSSVNNKNEENEFEIWRKQNQNILKEDEATIARLESMLIVKDKKETKKKEKATIATNKVQTKQYEKSISQDKQPDIEEDLEK